MGAPKSSRDCIQSDCFRLGLSLDVLVVIIDHLVLVVVDALDVVVDDSCSLKLSVDLLASAYDGILELKQNENDENLYKVSNSEGVSELIRVIPQTHDITDKDTKVFSERIGAPLGTRFFSYASRPH